MSPPWVALGLVAGLWASPSPSQGDSFPPGALSPQRSRDEFQRRHWAQLLRTLGEPPLTPAAGTAGIAYRMVMEPAFEATRMVRIERSTTGGARLTWKELPVGGGDPSPVPRGRERRLTEAEWNALEALVEAASFWTLPRDTFEMGVDGVTYLVEGARPGVYHAAHRWSPANGSFARLCRHLLDLAWAGGQRARIPVVDPRATGAAARATVSGRVVRASGAAAPAVTVLVQGGGVLESRATDAEGRFAVAGLVPGLYELQFQFSYRRSGEEDELVRSPLSRDALVRARGGENTCLRATLEELPRSDDNQPGVLVVMGCDHR